MVPFVGAYLGEVLVRNLGGEWILRQKLEESMVRVGDRASGRRAPGGKPLLLAESLARFRAAYSAAQRA